MDRLFAPRLGAPTQNCPPKVISSENKYSDGKVNHINGLEGFLGYLKRKLAAKKRNSTKKITLFSLENMPGDSITGNYLLKSRFLS